MLQYRDNINYSRPDMSHIDDDIAELKDAIICNDNVQTYQLYRIIRGQVFREIKIEELAVTLILNDLLQLRKTKPKAADLIEYYIANNTASYSEMARAFGCSKQNIHAVISRYAEGFVWLKNLMQIKGDYDSKNENNRTIFYQDIDTPNQETLF